MGCLDLQHFHVCQERVPEALRATGPDPVGTAQMVGIPEYPCVALLERVLTEPLEVKDHSGKGPSKCWLKTATKKWSFRNHSKHSLWTSRQTLCTALLQCRPQDCSQFYWWGNKACHAESCAVLRLDFSQSLLHKDPKQWTPCKKNPKHLRTKHPVDGKAMKGQELSVVLSTKGMSESVISKGHAKMVRQSPNLMTASLFRGDLYKLSSN